MTIRRITHPGLIFLFALCLAAPVFGQQPRAAKATRHSLWKVEGRRGAVYLLGSVHVLKPENYPLPAELEAAFTNAAIVAFEADLAAMEQLDTQMKMLSKARLPEGETFAQQLSPALYARFSKHLQEAGLPALMFEQLQPSMAAMTLVVVELQKLGFDPEYGLDKHFFDRARKQSKQLAFFETVDFQMDLLTGFSKAEGELLMKITLDDIDKMKKEFRDLLDAWQKGDADRLEKYLNEASREAPVIFKRLVTDRNQRWAPKIEEWLRGDKNVLAVVGAGHLVGKDGVVELLRKKGLKVTQQ